jgi:hypothetical protein
MAGAKVDDTICSNDADKLVLTTKMKCQSTIEKQLESIDWFFYEQSTNKICIHEGFRRSLL